MGKGMRAGKKPKNRQGGGDMQKQLKQLQAMQAEMEQTQAELEKKEVTTTAGGGAIEVTVNAMRQIAELEESEMNKITGGFGGMGGFGF